MTYKQKIESNIWKYTILLVCNKRTFMTLLGVYFLTFPTIEVQIVGLIASIGSMSGFLFEIPSGYMSDKMGHKKALVLSRFFTLASSLMYLFGYNFWFFVLGGIFHSAGNAFLSGTGTAFFHETLDDIKKGDQFSKIYGRVKSLGFVIPIPLIILMPFLAEVSFKLPFLLAALIDSIGLISAMSLTQPKKSKEEIKEVNSQNFKGVLKEIHALKFTNYLLYTAVLASIVMPISRFREIYQEFLDVPIVYFGLLWGASRVLISLFLPLNHIIKRNFSYNSFLLIKNLTTIALLFILSVSQKLYVVLPVLILITAMNHMFSSAKAHYQMEIIGKSKFKATIISVGAQIKEMLFVVTVFISGHVILNYSYKSFFFMLAILFTVSTIIGQIAISNHTKK